MTYIDDISPLKPGDHLGVYVIERQLGKVNMGVAYLSCAVRVRLGRRQVHSRRVGR